MAQNNKNVVDVTEEEQKTIGIVEEEEFHDVPSVVDEGETQIADQRRGHRHHHRVSRSNVIAGLVGALIGSGATAAAIYFSGKFGVKIDHNSVRNVAEQAPEIITC